MSWKTEFLGNILVESRIPAINPNPAKRIKVKLNVLGVEKRPVESEIEGATKQFIRRSGQFIYGKQNFHKGAFGIIPIELDGYETSADIPSFDVREDCLPEWIFYFFKRGNRYLDLEKLARGMGSKRIHPEQIADIEIQLPSITEQRWVLRKAKELEASISMIEQELLNQATSIKYLRQQILQDAIQGKLVTQNPDDEPASKLLERIKAEKELLLEQRLIRQGQLQVAEKQDDLLYEIPENWVWCKLDELCKNITDGTHQTPSYTSSGRIFLSAQNVKPFVFKPDDHKFVSEQDYHDYIKNRKPDKGDLLIGRVGAGIGETAVIDREIDFCFYVSLGLIQPFKNYVDSNYLACVINSPYGVKYSKGNISSKGGSAGNFNLGRIRSFLIPLPPLSEQHRIVQRIDQLMQYCDELEKTIQQNQKYTQELLQVALKEALSPKSLHLTDSAY